MCASQLFSIFCCCLTSPSNLAAGGTKGLRGASWLDTSFPSSASLWQLCHLLRWLSPNKKEPRIPAEGSRGQHQNSPPGDEDIKKICSPEFADYCSFINNSLGNVLSRTAQLSQKPHNLMDFKKFLTEDYQGFDWTAFSKCRPFFTPFLEKYL